MLTQISIHGGSKIEVGEKVWILITYALCYLISKRMAIGMRRTMSLSSHKAGTSRSVSSADEHIFTYGMLGEISVFFCD
jgi:hypothetical protein